MSAAVEVQGVSRRFGARVVLDDLSLTVEPEEFVALMGPSGCGKSTLLRLLARLDRPDEGRVVVPGRHAIAFQEPRLLPWEKVWRNVGFGLTGPGVRERALAALREVGLEHVADAWPKTLSGGEAQRAALARALALDPELLLLDEPFAAVDALTRLRLHALVRDLRTRHLPAILLVTHDVDEAIALADRIAVIGGGRIREQFAVQLSDAERRDGPARAELRDRLLHALGAELDAPARSFREPVSTKGP